MIASFTMAVEAMTHIISCPWEYNYYFYEFRSHLREFQSQNVSKATQAILMIGSICKVTSPILWSCIIYNVPLLIHGFILRFVKRPASQVVLLVSTIAYGIPIACGIWYAFVFRSSSSLPELGLFLACIFSLSVMIPAWIIVIVVEKRNRKKNAEP
ncbi:MAG: hypothetical protein FWE67_14815 [Planctomycetaceae bacterium]|nr:hypothetical protein [Planctomycetaceae bacterium]